MNATRLRLMIYIAGLLLTLGLVQFERGTAARAGGAPAEAVARP